MKELTPNGSHGAVPASPTPSPSVSIRVRPVEVSRIHEVDMNHIPFGRVFGDHMLIAHYRDGKWQSPQIIPYGDLKFSPAMSALNYGQSIFEGMKAFRSPEGQPLLFRPYDNHHRINRSAERMCMPPIPEHVFIDGLKTLINLDEQWIPPADKGALYIRPLYFATDEYIGVKNSNNYTFVIFTCPVGAYYKDPVNLLATKEFVRAGIGGTGSAKAAGNYAAAMLPDRLARERGYHNMLWLDGRDHLYIEECGTMNVFFVIDGTVLTPRLTGTILPGITRSSVIRLVKDAGYKFESRRISIHEIEEAFEQGLLEDAFGTGTAAGIAPINYIGFSGKKLMLPPME
ncbi:MAG: branched-chain amino acid aminotransferase [Bacteroidota bacterium]